MKSVSFHSADREEIEGKLLGGSNKPRVTCERRFNEILRYVYPPSKLTVPAHISGIVLCIYKFFFASVTQSAYGKQDVNGEKMDIPKLEMNRKLQLFMFLCMLLPQVYCWTMLGDEPYLLLSRWVSSFQHWQNWMHSPLFWMNFAAMAVERACYTIVWTQSRWFIKLCKTSALKEWGTPVDVVVRLFVINKIFQFGGLFLWYYFSAPWFKFAEITLYQWITGFQLIVFGQILNNAIYRAIGKAGVYYGVRLGQPVPYCTGFPFNVFTAHPQYFGSVSTAIGAGILVTTPAHEAAGLFGVCCSVIVQYVFMGVVEEQC